MKISSKFWGWAFNIVLIYFFLINTVNLWDLIYKCYNVSSVFFQLLLSVFLQDKGQDSTNIHGHASFDSPKFSFHITS